VIGAIDFLSSPWGPALRLGPTRRPCEVVLVYGLVSWPSEEGVGNRGSVCSLLPWLAIGGGLVEVGAGAGEGRKAGLPWR